MIVPGCSIPDMRDRRLPLPAARRRPAIEQTLRPDHAPQQLTRRGTQARRLARRLGPESAGSFRARAVQGARKIALAWSFGSLMDDPSIESVTQCPVCGETRQRNCRKFNLRQSRCPDRDVA